MLRLAKHRQVSQEGERYVRVCTPPERQKHMETYWQKRAVKVTAKELVRLHHEPAKAVQAAAKALHRHGARR